MRTVALLLALLLIGVGAACGGDDESADTGAATTEETPENQRLGAESWAEYTAARDQARTVNDRATTLFATCRSVIIEAENTAQVEKCMEGTTANVVAEGQDVLELLDSFEPEVAGACAAARTDLAGYVKLYIAGVNGINRGVEEGIGVSEAGVDDTLEALDQARKAQVEFTAACRPL